MDVKVLEESSWDPQRRNREWGREEMPQKNSLQIHQPAVQGELQLNPVSQTPPKKGIAQVATLRQEERFPSATVPQACAASLCSLLSLFLFLRLFL